MASSSAARWWRCWSSLVTRLPAWSSLYANSGRRVTQSARGGQVKARGSPTILPSPVGRGVGVRGRPDLAAHAVLPATREPRPAHPPPPSSQRRDVERHWRETAARRRSVHDLYP